MLVISKHMQRSEQASVWAECDGRQNKTDQYFCFLFPFHILKRRGNILFNFPSLKIFQENSLVLKYGYPTKSQNRIKITAMFTRFTR